MTVIRPAVAEDVPAILALIRDLAHYEREPDAVHNTEKVLAEHLFGSDPRIWAHVAENDDDDSHTVQGFALWFLNYSTWEGVHGIYLEDLYVRPDQRGRGHGKALLRALAGLAVERGYARVEWSVLDWNEPSIRFYNSLGAAAMDGWHTFRLDGGALTSYGTSSLQSQDA